MTAFAKKTIQKWRRDLVLSFHSNKYDLVRWYMSDQYVKDNLHDPDNILVEEIRTRYIQNLVDLDECDKQTRYQNDCYEDDQWKIEFEKFQIK